jgi:Gpi18-like mannosyltransferase
VLSLQSKFAKYLCIFLILILILFYAYQIAKAPGFYSDIEYWVYWSWFGNEHGLTNIYRSETNYLPLYHYILTGFGSFFEGREHIAQHIYLLKYVSFAFDLLGVYYLYKILAPRYSLWLIIAVSMLNIPFFYNSIMWGQVDGILSTLCFASFYHLYRKQFVGASIFMALALLFKLQAIVLLPLWGLYLLVQLPQTNAKRYFKTALIAFFVTLFLVALPFIYTHERQMLLKKAVTGLVGYYPNITVGAANFWSIFFEKDADNIKDTTKAILGINYKQLGLTLFLATSMLVFWPILVQLKKRWLDKANNDFPIEKLLLIAALCGLNFYLFNAQIHERYSHPVFLFLMAYSFLKKDFVPLIIFSLAYFLNLDSLLQWAKFENYNGFIFRRSVSGSLYLIAWAWLLFRLYQGQFSRRKLNPESL